MASNKGYFPPCLLKKIKSPLRVSRKSDRVPVIQFSGMEISDHLQDILKSAPDQPGCYLMKNQEGVIIYVGKAINLRHRVRSYFHASAQKIPAPVSLSEISTILSGS